MRWLMIPLLAVLAGCTFSRTVVNGDVRKIRTDWIQPGKTTYADVVKRLGLPPTSCSGRGGISQNCLRWVCEDSRTGELEAGYFLTPTFSRTRGTAAYDVLVGFDDAKVVNLVSRCATRSDGTVIVLDFREAK